MPTPSPLPVRSIRTLCLALAVITTATLATAAPPDDAATIRGVLDAQVVAWNKGDLNGFMAGYWKDDGLFFISGGKSLRGWTALKERYEKSYQAEGKEMGKLKFDEVNVEVLGDSAALVRGKWEVTMTKEKVDGWFTLLFRKVPGGWKITHDHTSK
jgi:beta-aspartyl-peptidase (threonine type)